MDRMSTRDSENNLTPIRMFERNRFVHLSNTFRQIKADHDRDMLRRNFEERDNSQDSDDNHEPNNKKDALKISSIKQLEEIISTFNGDDTTNIEHWLHKYEVIANACCWSDLQKVVYCKRMLRGSARKFIRLEKCCFSWKQLKSCLEAEFFTFPENITKQMECKLQINEINKRVSDSWIGRTRRPSALERFFQKTSNNSDNKFTLGNTTTLKQLKEDVAFYDSINMMNGLQLHDAARRNK
ncbi:PREDICTED: uncharacterized protein LOC106792532 [Polistes canadensis]|uniref:uncharacterized protein LOC106792532 n=1 Tax=Polistes canadensis TaxID=91411 RepID=UPI000718AE12|nr:PREDICTED: uncharacterized protein LOC106792532 [Polistes canadensis]